MVYYGRRYYCPSQGRFLGRDPKMEQGGLHLYAFCLNNPINLWDYLGMDPYLDKLLQRQSELETEIQGFRDTMQGLLDDENNAYVERGTHQSKIDGLNEQIAASERTLGGVQSEISAYGGTYTVGTASDGTTGQFIDRDGNMGAFNFNSPTINQWTQGWLREGVDPQTGQRWTIWRENQGLQDMTPMFFTGAQAASLLRGRALLTRPATTEASVVEKLDRYLLNPDHAKGGSKAEWFEQALGFNRGNSADLAKQLVFKESEAVQTGVTQFGTKFNQTIDVVGANGRTIPVTTAWMRGTDGVVRLVTAVPGG